MGVEPALIADYLGIVGDSSDNIPGVKGIGPKGAVALLEEFGSLEGVYENIDKVKAGKLRDNLIAAKENAILSKELATVRWDVGVEFTWDNLECRPNFSEEMRALLTELEFLKLGERIERLANGSSKSKGTPLPQSTEASSSVSDMVARFAAKYTCIQDDAALAALFDRLDKEPIIAFDTETTGLGHGARLVGFSLCASDTEAFYIPLRHVTEDKQCDLSLAIAGLTNFLKGKKIVGQNLKYDWNILRAEDLRPGSGSVFFDTMLASYALEPGERHGMDELSRRILGHETIKYSDVCGTGKNEISFTHVELDRATAYAAEDAHVTWLLFRELSKAIEKEPTLGKVFREIDLPLVDVLADMEWQGVRVDRAHLETLAQEFTVDLARLEKEAHLSAGQEFNLASPKQLQEILFGKLNLPAFKKTKTGFSTDVEVLEKLAVMHELPAIILSYREIAKLKSTYVDVLPLLADGEARVHTSYNLTVAATGRLSSSDPNLQNIPIRTELGKKIRAAFVSKPGHQLLGADYSQIELRVLAHLSGDEALVAAFKRGDDIHALTAAKIFEVDASDVTPDLRRKAKAINFGLLYGKTAFSLAEELAITRAEAANIIEAYFAQYPTVKKFLDGLVESAREKGYAETLYGRRRKIQGINDRNKMVKNMAERMATNTPIQGTAADLMKLAMIRVHNEIAKSQTKAKLILQVHDELVLEVPDSEVAAIGELVKRVMEGVGRLPGFPQIEVPLTVEIGHGPNWLEIT
jgi:DNA polymerase-1